VEHRLPLLQIWSAAGPKGGASVFDHVLRELVLSGRVMGGRESQTSMVIMDSKSIKNIDTAEEKGYAGGKKDFRSNGSPCC
jgi:hypothetical protein